MIKVAGNLNALCAKRAGLLSVPSKEEQALRLLTPDDEKNEDLAYELERAYVNRVGGNRLAGGLGGAAIGAAAGLPFGGVGAIPSAIGGGVIGAVGLPTAMELAADYKTDAGKKLLQDAELKDLMRRVQNAEKRRLVLNLATGAGLGAAAGFPFAAVGALPGALVGGIGGALYNRFTDSPRAMELRNTEEAVRAKKILQKLLAKR